MKIRIYIYADEYASEGWSLIIIKEGNYDPYEKYETATLLYEGDVPEPSPEQLIKIGAAKTEELAERYARQIVENETRLEEFRSKFLLLE